jgi:hypothetical protein
VPGSSREEVDTTPTNLPVEVAVTEHKISEQLPPIESFLDNTPQHSGSQFGQPADQYSPDFAEEPDELPPLEHFMDPLPDVAAFAPDREGALIDASPASVEYTSAAGTTRISTETGWVEDDWQKYDWRAAAALGDGVDAKASNEWATTNWDAGAPVRRDQNPAAAHAIASALDQIAQRIREGTLSVPPPGALTDPTAIAVTLAALLGVRR